MNTSQNKFGNWIKSSITARMLMVGVLIIILLIPLTFIKKLINERSHRQESVVDEINEKWGGEVLLYGPILKIPYKTYSERVISASNSKDIRKERIVHINYAYFFPNNLDISSEINPEVRKRGIYKTSVYKSEISVTGSYQKPNFTSKGIKDEDIVWDKAIVIIKTSNLKGINNQVDFKFNNKSHSFVPKYDAENDSNYGQTVLHKLETSQVDVSELISNEKDFSIELSISGSKQFEIIPIGKETNFQVKSNWETANFIGSFSRDNSDEIFDKGFDAKWKVLHINRPFSQEYFKHLPNLNEYSFGVNFMIPVDEYQKTERSVKYGFLVIALTFLVFFLIQTISNIPIHPFQYLMIGLALTMFYTLLISISEHSDFLTAYLFAGTSVIILIGFYSKSILKTIKFPIFIGLSLTALYTFIYVIIQLENYALLVGSIGLFAILAIVMYTSRKIDWKL